MIFAFQTLYWTKEFAIKEWRFIHEAAHHDPVDWLEKWSPAQTAVAVRGQTGRKNLADEWIRETEFLKSCLYPFRSEWTNAKRFSGEWQHRTSSAGLAIGSRFQDYPGRYPDSFRWNSSFASGSDFIEIFLWGCAGICDYRCRFLTGCGRTWRNRFSGRKGRPNLPLSNDFYRVPGSHRERTFCWIDWPAGLADVIRLSKQSRRSASAILFHRRHAGSSRHLCQISGFQPGQTGTWTVVERLSWWFRKTRTERTCPENRNDLGFNTRAIIERK